MALLFVGRRAGVCRDCLVVVVVVGVGIGLATGCAVAGFGGEEASLTTCMGLAAAASQLPGGAPERAAAAAAEMRAWRWLRRGCSPLRHGVAALGALPLLPPLRLRLRARNILSGSSTSRANVNVLQPCVCASNDLRSSNAALVMDISRSLRSSSPGLQPVKFAADNGGNITTADAAGRSLGGSRWPARKAHRPDALSTSMA